MVLVSDEANWSDLIFDSVRAGGFRFEAVQVREELVIDEADEISRFFGGSTGGSITANQGGISSPHENEKPSIH